MGDISVGASSKATFTVWTGFTSLNLPTLWSDLAYCVPSSRSECTDCGVNQLVQAHPTVPRVE